MTDLTRLSLLATVAATALLMPAAGYAQDTAAMDAFMQRSAQGTLSEPGGARRISGDITAQVQSALRGGDVKNVILFIGDGMGDSEITIARNYAEGASGYFKGIDALPITGQYTHYSLDKATGKPAYVTDSAASGTAWSTGVKSYNGAIGVDIHEAPHETLIELAKKKGLATGDITTSEVQDATPAVLISHVTDRGCYGPEATAKKCASNALENGGLGSISEQLLNTRADVTMGGGAKAFKETAKAGEWKDKTLLDQANARGFAVVTTADELKAITAATQDKPLLGLFAQGNLPVNWSGPVATYHGNLDQPAVTCAPNPEKPATQPSLADMTAKTIELLSTNANGFFLQVEGASIDKQDHASNACGQIGETVDLDKAVQVALEFGKTHPDTLIIVTADHAHSSQIIEHGNKAPGLTIALNTKDGAVMDVSYGNSETDSQGHTGTQLRIAAWGPRAGNFTGLTDQTDMFYTIRDALKLSTQAAAN